MKLGVMSALFSGLGLDGALKKCREYELDCIELPAGFYPGTALCNPTKLLSSKKALDTLKGKIAESGLEISAISSHSNPLHPDPKIAGPSHRLYRDSVRLAAKLGVGVVCNFSGCPGGSPRDAQPNWVTCPWPPEFSDILAWQWEKKVIPYWKKENKFALDHGVKIGFEMHPGFCVYNTETLLRLRKECGKAIGANFDPSHLFWQGMDPLASVRALKGCIWHVHAKDCRIEPYTTAVNGVLDTKHYGDVLNRSWVFRTVGYGHGEGFWRDFVSMLRAVGYDGVLSIEHEDSLMSTEEGFARAVSFLKAVLLREKPGGMWWA